MYIESLIGTLIGNVLETSDDVLYVYLTAWTRENHTLNNQYLIKHSNTSRISICYQHNGPTSASCLLTSSMSWQEVMRWNVGPCSDDKSSFVLDVQDPIKSDVYKCKPL